MNVDWVENIKTIYEKLMDDTSKEIFANRMMYSLTEDHKYIANVVKLTELGKEIHEKLVSGNEKKIIFGAGIWGKNIYLAYPNIPFECFIDNREHSDEELYFGIPIKNASQWLKGYNGETIVIASRLYHQEMYKQLLEAKVAEANIINAGGAIDDMSRKQYFDLPILREFQVKDEVFVDGGSFDGKTSQQFVHWCKNSYKKIYAFEPDKDNLEKCTQTIENVCGDRGIVINKGLWNEDAELKFKAISNGSSKVSWDGETSIFVAPLDDMVEDKVTFIKYDLEGAEVLALLGAKRIITECKPKLAISVYHKPEDIWEIAGLLLKLNPEYKFYLRHYSVAASETILYAV